jgi:septal ring factor EnvC (AmiA/AmiB activator)
MKLYNQTEKTLRWSMAGSAFACEPWGVVEVAGEVVDLVKRRGLPLGPAPVAAESRASRKAALAKEEAEAADLIVLRKRTDEAEAQRAAAQRELEEVQIESERVKKRADGLAAKLKACEERCKDLEASTKALDAQLRDMAAKMAEASVMTKPADEPKTEAPKKK